jgi:hypothetical protein
MNAAGLRNLYWMCEEREGNRDSTTYSSQQTARQVTDRPDHFHPAHGCFIIAHMYPAIILDRLIYILYQTRIPILIRCLFPVWKSPRMRSIHLVEVRNSSNSHSRRPLLLDGASVTGEEKMSPISDANRCGPRPSRLEKSCRSRCEPEFCISRPRPRGGV